MTPWYPGVLCRPRAFLRGFLLAHTIFWGGLYGIILFLGGNPLLSPLAAVALLFPGLIVAIDVGVVLYYSHKIQPGDLGAAWKDAFVYGITWEKLRKMYRTVQGGRQAISRYAEHFPAVRSSPEFTALLDSGEWMKAFAMVVRAEKEAQREQKIAERAKRDAARLAEQQRNRSERRQGKLRLLYDEGKALGFSEEELDRILSNPPSEIRRTFDIRKEHQDLLAQAEKFGCVQLVHSLLMEGEASEARKAIAFGERLVTQAHFFGIHAEVHQHMQAGRIDLAEQAVALADQRHRSRILLAALRVRIEKLPLQEHRALLGLLEPLEQVTHGGREFRIHLHSLEQALEAVEARGRTPRPAGIRSRKGD